jgi:WD40 repeat protein
MNTGFKLVALSLTTVGLCFAQAVAQTKAKPETVLKGHVGAVSSIAISADGKRIVSGGEDRIVRIWDIEKCAEIQTLVGHKSQVLSVAFSPNGKRVASGGKDKTIMVWDATDGGKVFKIADLKTPVTGVLFSQSGKWIFSTSGGPVVQVWDAAKGEPNRQSLARHQSDVNCLSLSGNGKRLVTGTDDVEKHGGQIKVYELSNGHSPATLAGMVGAVNSVAFSPDATLIASASGDAGQTGELRVWETDEEVPPIILTGHTGRIDCVAFSPDGKRVASGGADKVVRLWDPRKGSMVGTFVGHSSNVHCVAFSHDDKSIISGGSDGTVRIWDAEHGIAPLAAKGQAGKEAVSVPRRGNYSGIRDTPREVKVPVSTPLLTLTTKQQIMAAAFSPDGKRIVTGGRQATLTLWDAEKATEIRTFPRHENDIQGVAFSPDGLRIASASGDQTVRVWDAGNGKTVLTLKGFTPQVKGVAFAPDGKRIAGAGVGTKKDATVQIWDASTGQLFRALKVEGEEGTSNTVSFSPDGKLIAADFSTNFPQTGVIRVWEVESGELVQTLVGHSGNVWCAAFSPDGKHLVSSGGLKFHSGQIKV